MTMDFTPVGGGSGGGFSNPLAAVTANSGPSPSLSSLRPASVLDLAGAATSRAPASGSRLSLNLGSTLSGIRNFFLAPAPSASSVPPASDAAAAGAPAAPAATAGLDDFSSMSPDQKVRTLNTMAAKLPPADQPAAREAIATALDRGRMGAQIALTAKAQGTDLGSYDGGAMAMDSAYAHIQGLLSGANHAKDMFGLSRINALGDAEAARLLASKDTGKYWGTSYAADPETMNAVNRSLGQYDYFMKMADQEASAGRYTEAQGYLSNALQARDAAVASKNLSGRIEERSGFMGLMIESRDGTTTPRHFDWQSLAALSAIVLPIASTIYSTEMQRQSAKMQLDWQAEENEKDRQNALDQLRISGQYQIEAAQIAAGAAEDAKSHPAVGASSVPSLGGSFSG